MITKGLLIAFLFFNLLSFEGSAQNYPVVFNENSGLPSNHVYDCAQSNDGKIWITTDKGISSFDGYHFENYATNENLSTLFSWRMTKDSHDRIWLHNYETPFTYIQNNKIHRIGEHYENFFLSDIIEEKNGSVFITSTKIPKTYEITRNNKVIVHDSMLMCIYNHKKYWRTTVDSKEIKSIGYFSVMRYFTSTICCSFEIINRKKNDTTYFTSQSIVNCPLDFRAYSDSEMIITSQQTGMQLVNLNTLQEKPLLESFSKFFDIPICVRKDGMQNLWIPDQNRGLIFMKHLPRVISYIPYPINLRQHSMDNAVQTNDSVIHLITNNTEAFDLNNHFNFKSVATYTPRPGKSFYFNINDQPFSFIGSSVYFENSLYNGTVTDKKTDFLFDDIIIEKKNKLSCKLNLGYCKTYSIHNKNIYIGTNQGCFMFEPVTNGIKIKQWDSGYVYGVAANNNYIYLSNLDAIKKINTLTNKKEVLFSRKGFNQLFVYNNYLYAKASDGILLQIDLASSKVVNELLNFRDIEKYFVIEDVIFGISAKRLVLIEKGNFAAPKEITALTGVNNPHKISICKLNSNYLLMCEEGIYSFKKAIFDNTKQNSSIYFDIKSITVNGVLKDFSKAIQLNSELNQINIKLNAFYYPNSNALTFQYQFGEDSWNTTKTPELTILNLPYGKYDVRIRALDENGEVFGEILNLTILNPTPFYKSRWFILLCIIIFGCFLFYVLMKRNKQELLKVQNQFMLAQNQQKMLIMQMKPHFLSNVFNNLQGVLLQGDLKNSLSYIHEVNNYLRKTLSFSVKQINNLKDEIEFTTEYINIEKTRIDKPINFILPTNWDEYKLKINLPVFILQPIVENAIWHGIVKSDNPTGEIKLSVSENSHYYIVEIADNGAGFSNLKSSGNSIALKNIDERLSLFDQKKLNQYVIIKQLEIGINVSIYVAKQN